jgi:hypothetical protein
MERVVWRSLNETYSHIRTKRLASIEGAKQQSHRVILTLYVSLAFGTVLKADLPEALVGSVANLKADLGLFDLGLWAKIIKTCNRGVHLYDFVKLKMTKATILVGTNDPTPEKYMYIVYIYIYIYYLFDF